MTPNERNALLRTGQRLLREGLELGAVIQRLAAMDRNTSASHVQDAARTLRAVGNRLIDEAEGQ